jgi:hypothetical protein
MDMQQRRHQSAVERVLNTTDRTGPKRQPAAPIPDDLVLPDGRCYNVRGLLEQVSRTHNITVGIPRPLRIVKTRTGRKAKYGPRDFEFMAHATLDQIHQRYSIGRAYCRQLQLASIKYIAQHGYSESN